MTTFSPAIAPNVGSSGSNKFRILEAKFGDQYTQAAGDGINTREATFTLNWTHLTVSEYDAIEAFFIARAGYESFEYTLPNKSSAEKFRCKSFNEVYELGNLKGLTAILEKVYDL